MSALPISDEAAEAVGKQMLLDDCEGAQAAADRLWKGEDRELYMESAPRAIQAFLAAEGFEVEQRSGGQRRLVSPWRPA